MSSKIVDQVSALIGNIETGKMAVVIATSPPRLLGTVDAFDGNKLPDDVRTRADLMVIAARCSSQYISLAECNGSRVVIAHG
jgi:hypothetical protein